MDRQLYSDNYAEKVNIYVPGEIGEMLLRDMKMFEIYKDKGKTINRSGFLNMLVQGYYDTYVEEKNKTYNDIIAALQPLELSEKTRNEIADRLMSEVIQPAGKRGGKGSCHLPFKPAGRTKSIVQLIRDDYVSQYFRRMLISYCSKPFSQREQILFRDKYVKLSQCCKKQQPIIFTTFSGSGRLHEVIPYAVAVGAEEMYNYLLCQEENQNTHHPEARAYLLHRIDGINISTVKGVLDADVKRHLKQMQKLGPGYAINDDEEICVRLTELGERNYRRIYFGRPQYARVEERTDGVYHYYQCSQEQVFQFYRRFDHGSAEIIAPASLRQRMKRFYQEGNDLYSDDSL